jgi:hypothetical protein
MMRPPTLSEHADQLLSAAGLDRERPAYTEPTLERKLRRARQRERSFSPRELPPTEATNYLQQRDLIAALKASRLTVRQFQVFAARIGGDTWLEIGRTFGHSKQGAQKVFSQAVAKVRRTWRHGPYADLHQVYLAEVMRFAPCRTGRKRR